MHLMQLQLCFGAHAGWECGIADNVAKGLSMIPITLAIILKFHKLQLSILSEYRRLLEPWQVVQDSLVRDSRTHLSVSYSANTFRFV